MRRRRFSSNTVRTVGALLPSDVLAKAMASEGLEGLNVEDYGFDADARLRDVVNDAWNEAKAHWWRLQSELRDLPEDDLTATAITRDRLLLPLLELLGFDEMEVLSSSIDVGGTDYPISHMWGSTPLHLMGARVELDARVPGIRGAARLSPHSLVQQFLNRSDRHLWGVVTNGTRLRILRDSVSLTRQAFVEFDLEAMFNGEVFPDFVLLYKVAHATRFAGDRSEDCLLERWIAAARNDGIRALDQLREGVETALTTLGSGFLGQRDNQALRDAVDAGDIDAKEMYRYLLRLIYRFLFLFVAEDRDLLLVPDASPEARDRYDRFYSTVRLRELASRPMGSGHSDLWEGLTALMDVLGRDEGEPRLGLAGMGSFLWSSDAIGPLADASLDNEELLIALRGLAYVVEDGVVRRIDFAAMGAEELGSVYESLLELHPSIDSDARTFILGGGAGSERKTTGSYYTPTELISELLDSALDPVLAEAAAKEDPERAILDLKVVDPAAGSGHFLVAAAHRIGKKLAEVRTGEPEPPAEAYRTAVRDVVSRCLFAVDINDLAIELCKVSLWLEALEPGKPLSFLDHHILVGNSLFGATPAAIAGGIPDDAFVALTGDDKKVVSALKKRNKRERSGQGGLLFDVHEAVGLGSELETLEEFNDSDLETVRTKERMLAEWKVSTAYAHARLVADAWCGAFTIEKTADSSVLTEAVFRNIRDGAAVGTPLLSEIEQLRNRFGFFHWHLAFPQVFNILEKSPEEGPGWKDGFDVVLGNPPWERVKLQEKEFFAPVAPEIAKAPNKAARQRLIDQLDAENPPLSRAFRRASHDAEALSHFLRRSGRYPLCGRGDVNTYTVFAELMRTIVGSEGRIGVIVPTGIATDDTTKHFFADLVERRSLASLFDFENKNIFPGVHSSYKFCLLTMTGPARPIDEAEFCFFAHSTAELRDPDRRFTLTSEDFRLLNPNTRTCPIFRTRRDAEITKGIYRRIPVLVDETRADGNPWGIEFGAMFHSSSAAHLFASPEDLGTWGATRCGALYATEDVRWLPLYEAKMVGHLEPRAADIVISANAVLRPGQPQVIASTEKRDPTRRPRPRYWVREPEVELWLAGRWDYGWLLGWRDVTSATNERTIMPTAIPRTAVIDTFLLALPDARPPHQSFLLAGLGSFVVDFVARQKIGGTHAKYYLLRQLPVISFEAVDGECPWGAGSLAAFTSVRIAELIVNSVDLSALGSALVGARVPYRINPARYSFLRAELDAAFFHLYGIDRHDVDYIMQTFPIVKRRDIAEHGSYRTKELILDVYDRMAKAIEIGEPYQTILDPPPADPSLRADVETVS